MSMVYSEDAFSRIDESDDHDFYRKGRFKSHLDASALATVEKLISSVIVEEKPVILDLMAGWDSHIPASLKPEHVVGLGIDESELCRNQSLDERLVHDLNRDPRLPFDDDSFDVVLNTISVQYLTRPFDVFIEVERVLKPGGLHLVIFSNRMFNTKAVKIWYQSSPEERVWLVEDFFAVANFSKTRTLVSEGRPRPEDDRYAGSGLPADPVYAVFAEKEGGDSERPPRPLPRLSLGTVVDHQEVERRKLQVEKTLRCPYCDTPMTRWEIPDSPFIQWDSEYVYVCFNNECPYMLEGWDTMREQGNPGFSYRLMYIPERNAFKPTPLPSAQAMKETVIVERG
jgi:SAM-dependent methyltransferase